MAVKSRIALIVQAEGARRASSEIDGVARSTKSVGKETDVAGRKMRAGHSASRGFSSGLRGIGTAAKFGAGAVAVLGAAVAKGAVDEFREAYKVGRQTNAVIKSTGGAANVSAKSVGDLANSLSLKSGIDDEAIQSGENLLLTFTKVRNEAGRGNKIFDKATATALDMSAALGQDMKASTIQLGKALNDPIEGITALSRVGVTFDDGQKKQIKSLVEHGRTMDAQKVILRELNKEFGGSAKAQADPINKAKVAWQNLEETLGKAVFPTLSRGATAFATFVNQLQDGTGAGGKFGEVIKQVVTKAVDLGRQFVTAFRQAVGPIRPIGTAVALVGKRIAQVAHVVLPGFKQQIRGLATQVGGAVRLITAIIHGDFRGAWKAAKTIVKGAADQFVGRIRSSLALINKLFGGLPAKIGGALGKAGGFLLGIGKKVGKWIVDGIVGAIRAAPGAVKDAIKSITPDWVEGAVGGVTGAASDVGGAVGKAGGAAGKAAGAIGGIFRAGGGTVQPGEITVVGEKGPEVAQFPAGTRIHPHGTGPNLSGAGGHAELARLIGAEVAARLNEQRVVLDPRDAAAAVRRVGMRDLLAKAPT